MALTGALSRFRERRFSAQRSQGNCASSKAIASAVVGAGAAHGRTARRGVGNRANRARRARWLCPKALPRLLPARAPETRKSRRLAGDWIALWLGHESVETTQIYLDADLALNEQVLAKTKPIKSKAGRYRPDDDLLAYLKTL